MKGSIDAYFKKLSVLSDAELDEAAERLVLEEKRNVAAIIAHLAEIGDRRIALKLGYKGLFDYCVRHLNLSEGSVYLRLQVASVCRKFPQILERLAANRLSLSVAGLVAPHLSEETVEKFLRDCEGKTKSEVKEYLVPLKPKEPFDPGIRKQPKRGGEGSGSESAGSDPAEAAGGKDPTGGAERSPPSGNDPSPSKRPGFIEPAQVDVYNFRFSAEGSFKTKFERLAEVLGIENPTRNMTEVLERACDSRSTGKIRRGDSSAGARERSVLAPPSGGLRAALVQTRRRSVRRGKRHRAQLSPSRPRSAREPRARTRRPPRPRLRSRRGMPQATWRTMLNRRTARTSRLRRGIGPSSGRDTSASTAALTGGAARRRRGSSWTTRIRGPGAGTTRRTISACCAAGIISTSRSSSMERRSLRRRSAPGRAARHGEPTKTRAPGSVP